MKNILLLCEAYGGGVKTYIDVIVENKMEFPAYNFNILISSKRLENDININKNYQVDDNLSFGMSPIKLYKALKNLNKYVRDNKIDIIHANSTFSGLLIYLYSFFNKNVSYIYTPHGYYSLKSMNKLLKYITRRIEKKINNICETVIHVSKSEEEEALKFNLVSKDKSIVIFNGVTEPKKSDEYDERNIFTVVNLARVDDQKDPYKFLEIAIPIVSKNDNIQFIWAGNGKYLNDIREKVKQNKLEKKIKFIGFVKEKNILFNKADIYLSTSEYEGLPFSVVEAMSYKLPLILSNVVGHTDLVENGENGYLYDFENFSTAIEYLNSIILNSELYEKLAKSSYQFYKEKFSVDQMMRKLLVLYDNN
ncbi:glycosyltransferase [Niallia sp. Sow4_A1]|uniref:glycosyltransferase n=1 Tax=Niallia sp. Sow4_A1 TaxID=3438793 RepID=UPI003F998056